MKCTRCRWSKNKKGINCVGFEGNPQADYVFMGEAFGAKEAETGKFFVGESGTVFDSLLKVANLTRDDVVLMNAMRCYQEGNPTPTHKELDACFLFSQRDIAKINPKLVVAMGSSACYSLTGKKLSDYIGKLLFSDKINRNVYITYHPTSSQYDTEKWWKTVEQFKRIPFVLKEKPFVPKNFDYIFIDTLTKFDKYINLLEDSPHLFLDTETTGLNPWVDTLNLVQLGTDTNILLFNNEIAQAKSEYLRNLITSKGIVGAGFEFDHKFLHTRLNIDIQHYKWDVVLAEYVLSGVKDNDLSYLTKKYVPESAGYDDSVKEQGGAQNVSNQKELQQYAANDVGVIPIIMGKQYKELAKNNQLWLYENLTLPTNKILTEMSLGGVLYDTDKIKEIDSIYERKAQKLLYRVKNLDSVLACEKHFKRIFNPRSSQMVSWLLIDYYKLPVLAETDKGNPSVGATEMNKYAEEYKNPYCELMENYRSYMTLRDNFLSGVLPKLVDGVAHTTYSQHATATGRPNSKEPNLLNIPAKAKDIKKCIIARPGHIFVYADESQLEMRVASVVYDDLTLIEIINSGKDFHSMVTAKVYNVTYDTVYDEQNKKVRSDWEDKRRITKAISFGVLYGEGPQKLAYTLGITVKKAEKFIEQHYEGFPSLKENIEKTKELVIKQGYLDNYFGFRRRWQFHSEEDHSTLKEAVNFLVQSLAWNLIQLAMIRVDRELKERGLKSRLVLQVYDSLVVEALNEEVPEVAFIIKNAMENVNKPYDNINRVLLKSDIEIGLNLAELEKYEG